MAYHTQATKWFTRIMKATSFAMPIKINEASDLSHPNICMDNRLSSCRWLRKQDSGME